MSDPLPRTATLACLAQRIAAVCCTHPVRVAIDGVDAAGKTRLADDLVPPLEEFERPVIRASIDGFHRPRMFRYRQGADSPQGYYQDSFDLEALRNELLIPLGPGGCRQYRRQVFDHRRDVAVHEIFTEAPEQAILLFDGVFLLRPELVLDWDFSVFVDVDFEVSVPRALRRDLPESARPEEIQAARRRYEQRYLPGQRMYFQQAQPWERATVILNNNDYDFPRLAGGG